MIKCNIKQKILYSFILMAAIPIVITSFILDWQANSSAQTAIEEQVKDRLTALRELKKDQIELYFKTLEKQVRSYSTDPAIVLSMQSLSRGFKNDREVAASSVNDNKEALTAFYNTTVADEYNKYNPANTSLNIIPSNMDALSSFHQYTFMVENQAPLSEKHFMIDPDNGSMYGTSHAEYHTRLYAMLDKLEIEDLLLINPDGYVVYSAMKNIDFAVSLKQPPFNSSNLAQVYQRMMTNEDVNAVSISDMSTYIGNLDKSTMYIASPVQDVMDEDAYERLGVLVFKIPTSKINNIMTNNAQWKKSGLGSSGNIFLVGQDYKIRSTSRKLTEEKDNYLKQLLAAGIETIQLEKIEKRNSIINLVSEKNSANESALAGNSGISIVKNHLGNKIISAYAPLKIPGLKWIISTELDTKEAFHAQANLQTKTRLTAVVITLIMIAIAIASGFFFASNLTRPIIKLSREITEIEKDSDLTQRININSQDEIGTMAIAINNMLEKFRSSIDRVSSSTTMMATASEQMSVITTQTSNGIEQQFNDLNQVASSINAITTTVQDVTNNAKDAANSASHADEQALSGKVIVDNTVQSINTLSDVINRTAGVVHKLEQDSEQIGTVMDVIKTIAEQTNLLALNAAIEAARAGEQGRGFAVVADEVRNLAQRTQKSAVEIEDMIDSLRQGTQDAVEAMQAGLEQTQDSVNHAHQAGQALETITSAVNSINEINNKIAEASQEQQSVMEEINKNIINIRTVAEESTTGAQQTTQSSGELSGLAVDLQHMVNEFKT
jgi:methyl-accepting chemotaxis protein